MDLQGKHIVLGVTGGVAAYKAAELTRLLVKAGATVQVVLTAAGARFVGAATFQALTGRPVFDDLWDTRVGNGMAHIELTREVVRRFHNFYGPVFPEPKTLLTAPPYDVPVFESKTLSVMVRFPWVVTALPWLVPVLSRKTI